MSLLSNPNVIRMGIYSTWSSSWYENDPVYSTLIYTDLYINEFLNGIYYKLKMPTTLPSINEIGYNQILITTKSFVSFKKRRSRMKKMTSYLSSIKLRHRKILFLLRRALRKIKILNFYRRSKELFYKNNSEKFLYQINVNKKLNIKKVLKNKKKYLDFIKNVKYKIRGRKKRFKKIKKYLLKNILYKLENIKNKTNLNKIDLNKVSNFKKNKQIKNKIIYRNKRKYQLSNYKKEIKKFRKYKINNKRRRISRKRAIRRKLFFKKNTIRKKKYKNKINLKKIDNNIKNKNIILFNWLINKINRWFFLLILKSIISLNLIIKNNSLILNNKNIDKKEELFIFNLLNKNINKVNNKNEYNIIENINRIRNILLQLNSINNLKIKSITSFSTKIKMAQLNFRDKMFHYMRIKSYYRRKKRIKRYKKLKELELRFPPKFYTLNVRLFKSMRKWTSLYYRRLLYKQLQLKIRETLSRYLHKFIIFIPYYKRGTFPRLDSPKLLADYIKLLMKYENRNPSILKKIVASHSRQRKKQRKISYDLMRRLFKLRRKIRFKLNKHNKLINIPFVYKVKIKKKVRHIGIFTKNEKKRKISFFKYNIKNKKYNRKHFNKINKLKNNYLLDLDDYSQLINKRNNNYRIKVKKIKNKKIALSIYKFNYNNNKIKFFKSKKIKDNVFSVFKKNINKEQKNLNKYNKNKYNKNVKYKNFEYINKFKKQYQNQFINKEKIITKKLRSIYYYRKNTLKNILNKINKKNNSIKIYKDKILLLDYLKHWRFKFRDLSYKKYPLIGIRIECSGPTKKGRRTQTHLYNEWVDFYRLPGTMPLVTVMNDIQYWQTYGLTRRAAIGIKLWMHFYPAIYSAEKKKLLNKIK